MNFQDQHKDQDQDQDQADVKDLQAMGRKSEVVKRVRNQLLA